MLCLFQESGIEVSLYGGAAMFDLKDDILK